MLTVAYITARRECHVEWFLESLLRQGKPELILVVDSHYNERDHSAEPWASVARHCKHVAQKPNAWNGPHRRTKDDWFAAANQRNTALCYAPDGYIAYVDDLSVLMPGWLDRVRAGVSDRDIMLGSYLKVHDLVVHDGVVSSYRAEASGRDSRLAYASQDKTLCGGSWMYGCSLAGPVEAFLAVNGWPEDLCDGMGSEDSLMGVVLGNLGRWRFWYDKQMRTLESEPHHHLSPSCRRSDYGVSPHDKSHAALSKAMQSKRFDNIHAFGRRGIRPIRDAILKGRHFPIPTGPTHEWFTKTRLEDL